ncbi:MAG: DUF2884 family protein [Burkholderiales bacterium]
MHAAAAPGLRLLIVLATMGAAGTAAAAEPACTVRSRYDMTVTDAALVFERTAAPGQHLEMQTGRLAANGALVELGLADRNRIAAFETNARTLVPQLRALAQRGVDLGVAAIREEAAATSPKSATNVQLNARLDARARTLKARIAASNSSKDWRGPAVKRYMAEAMTDVVPLIGGDLAQQALEAALRGDLAAAAAIKGKAERVRPSLEARIQRKLETLQPEVDRLCPALRQLDTLESGMAATLPDGSRLNLVDIGG